MKLEDTRNASWVYLQEKRPSRLAAFIALLQGVDRCVDEYETMSASDTYARVCGLTLLKAKNLSLGAFSLLLDGLGQEAGALLRPMIEYIELLTYLRRFPEQAENAATNKLPSAGERAKAIEGKYQELRKHLNEHASHSSYSSYSLAHLLTPDFSFRKMQQFVPVVVDQNMRDLAVQVLILQREAVLTLDLILPTERFEALAAEAEEIKTRLIDAFELRESS